MTRIYKVTKASGVLIRRNFFSKTAAQRTADLYQGKVIRSKPIEWEDEE